ncbi:MAG: glycosyltransferase family 4 protein, partial [Actinomycetota bacterium]
DSPGPPHGRLVLGVGRLVEKKGWPILLEACSIMKKDGVDFKCILAGEGEEREALLTLRSELGLEETLELRGGLRRREVLTLMAQARVFAAPCVTALDGDKDALPTVILEALAVGTPVVSTPVNGIPEIIENGTDGLLVPERDPAELAAAITRLLDDDPLAKQLAEAGRRTVATRFNRDRTLPQLEEVFRQSIQHSSPGEIRD